MGTSLQDLLDEREIIDVAIRYAFALDRKDWALLDTVFATDGILVAGPIGDVSGPAAIGQAIAKVLDGQTTQHFNGNHQVHLGNEGATHTCYLIAQHVRAGMAGNNWYTFAGVYTDDMVKTSQGWRIRRRELRPIWTNGNPEAHTSPAGRIPD